MHDRRPIRVLMADDHPVVRAGIVSMLSKEPDIRVIGETGDGEQVERLTVETAPDVLVLDVNMPGFDPVAVTRNLTQQRPDLRILVLTAYDDEAYVAGLLSAGATGYVLKDEALDSLVAAIRTIAKGESWLSQRIAGRLARKAIAPVSARAAKAEPLTPREREVLRLLALGLSNDEIAERLFITKRTVQNHVSNIYGKLDLDSRAEAVLYAIRQGIVNVNEVKGL
jgi:NarL family two-component system response regulator LiaR